MLLPLPRKSTSDVRGVLGRAEALCPPCFRAGAALMAPTHDRAPSPWNSREKVRPYPGGQRWPEAVIAPVVSPGPADTGFRLPRLQDGELPLPWRRRVLKKRRFHSGPRCLRLREACDVRPLAARTTVPPGMEACRSSPCCRAPCEVIGANPFEVLGRAPNGHRQALAGRQCRHGRRFAPACQTRTSSQGASLGRETALYPWRPLLGGLRKVVSRPATRLTRCRLTFSD